MSWECFGPEFCSFSESFRHNYSDFRHWHNFDGAEARAEVQAHKVAHFVGFYYKNREWGHWGTRKLVTENRATNRFSSLWLRGAITTAKSVSFFANLWPKPRMIAWTDANSMWRRGRSASFSVTLQRCEAPVARSRDAVTDQWATKGRTAEDSVWGPTIHCLHRLSTGCRLKTPRHLPRNCNCAGSGHLESGRPYWHFHASA